MWWWRKVRIATISETERALFEKLGATTIQLALAGGFTPSAQDLHQIYHNAVLREKALNWLTEQRDIQERKEDRLETVEWAILIIFVFSLAVETAQLFHEVCIFGFGRCS